MRIGSLVGYVADKAVWPDRGGGVIALPRPGETATDATWGTRGHVIFRPSPSAQNRIDGKHGRQKPPASLNEGRRRLDNDSPGLVRSYLGVVDHA